MDVFSLTATLGLDASSFVSGLSSAGKLMAGFAEAVVNFGTDVIQTGMGFDKQMASVQAVLGKTEGTTENLARLRAFALDQAHGSIFTAEQTGQAYYYMGMAGWKTEQMLAGLPGIMNLAAASGEDLGRVSDIVTDSITAFGLSANDVSSYVDTLAATVTNSNTDVDQLGTAFKYVASVAGGLGVDVDDVALSLGVMANAGIKSSQAGTTMRQMFTRLSNDTAGARTTMESLGTTIYDANGNMRDWGDILTEARAGWKGLTDEQKAQYATTIAGQRGMSGFMALMEATDDEYVSLERHIAEASGAAEEMADTKLDNLWGDTVKFNSALDVLKIAIYDDVKGPMREIVQYATGAVDRIREAIEAGGLEGGIEQFGIEIEAAGEKFAPMLESIGTALAPMIEGLITNITPALETAGAALAQGMLNGLSEAFGGTSSPTLQMIGKLFGFGGDTFGGILGNLLNPNETRSYQGTNALSSGAYQGPTMQIGGVEVSAADIQTAIDNATSQGGQLMVTIGTETMEISIAEALKEELTPVGEQAGAEITSAIGTSLSGVDTSGLGSAIGNVGTSAGNTIKNGIQTAISAGTYAINVVARVTGLPSGTPTTKNARAMNIGHIFTTPTIFGYAEGSYQMAGDAGPEAVVGTSSLSRMVDDSARQGVQMAMAPLMQAVIDISQYMPQIANRRLVMPSSALGSAADRELGKRAKYAERRNA